MMARPRGKRGQVRDVQGAFLAVVVVAVGGALFGAAAGHVGVACTPRSSWASSFEEARLRRRRRRRP